MGRADGEASGRAGSTTRRGSRARGWGVRLLDVGASLFVAASVWHTIPAAWFRFEDPAGTFRTYSVQKADGGLFSAWGLTYQGMGGFWLATAQTLFVAAAWVTTRSRREPLRRTGLGLVAAWALLWAGNMWWIAWLEGGPASPTSVGGAFFFAMQILPLPALWWAALAWRRPRER